MIMWLYLTQKDPIYWNIVLIYFDCDINDNSLDILTWEPLKSNIIPLFFTTFAVCTSRLSIYF